MIRNIDIRLDEFQISAQVEGLHGESAQSARRRKILRLVGCIPFIGACGRATNSPAKLALGQQLPSFHLPDLYGDMAIVEANTGPVVVNFWATWCAPCRAEMAGFNRTYLNLKGRGLAIYGISVDDDINLVREFVLQHRIEFPILWDQSGRIIQKTIEVQIFPTTVLVSRRGHIVDISVGERRWDEVPALNSIEALL